MFSVRQAVRGDWEVPNSVENFGTPRYIDDWVTCKWICRAPQIAREILTLMSKKIPLWIIEYIFHKSQNEQLPESEIENLLEKCICNVVHLDETKQPILIHCNLIHCNPKESIRKEATEELVRFHKYLRQIINEIS